MEFFLKPRTRAYRPRVDKTGFENKSMEKLAQRNMYLKKAEEDRKMVLRYIEGSRLELSKIHETVSIAARETLLRWIAAANLTDSAKGRTEYGQAYRLIKTKETCTLKCEDGDLVMPSYILEFAEEENGSGSDSDTVFFAGFLFSWRTERKGNSSFSQSWCPCWKHSSRK